MDKVLLVDDSIDCQILVTRALQDAAHVTVAPDIGTAKRLLQSNEYELLLLDVGLPDGDGFGFCSSLLTELGARHPRVLFLTGSRDISDKLTGFSVGGDDYLIKPFDPLELKARVQAHLRNRHELIEAARTLRLGNLELNLAAYAAEVHENSGTVRLDLTPTEFKLLYHLAKNEGRILSREQMLTGLFDGKTHVTDRTIDAHLSRVRKKLADCTHNVEAIYGIGYRLVHTRR